MFFKKFDLKNHIKQFNVGNSVQYLEDSNFGFKYFNLLHENHFNRIIDLINNPDELCIFNEMESKFVKSLHQELRATIKDIDHSMFKKSAKTGGIFHNIHFTQEEIDSLNEHVQLKHEWFNWINSNWIKLNKQFIDCNIDVSDDYYEQGCHWNKHYLIAKCNDTALYRICNEMLPSLITYVKKAKMKLMSNKHKIPNDICLAYKNYLHQLEDDIKKFQNIIIESILARLEAFDDSKSNYSNPILHTIKKISPMVKHPNQPYCLNSEEFNFFHNYIEKNANPSQVKQLYKRSWYISNNTIPTTVVKTIDNGSIIVPQLLSNLVPVKRRWPNWLFGDNLRQDIFKQCSLLFSTLSFQANRTDYFIDIYDPSSCQAPLNDIIRCESLLLEELSKLTKTPLNQVPWYLFGVNSLLRDWKTILKEQQHKLIEKKFALAERLINCLKSKAVSPMDIPWKSYELLIKLSQELEGLVNDASVNKSLQERMFAINSTLSKYASINKFVEILKILADGNLPTDEQLNYLHRFMDGRIKLEPAFLESFKQFCKTQLDLIYKQYENKLKVKLFNLKTTKEINEHEKLTIALFSILDKTKMIEPNDTYAKQIYKISLHHLQKLYSVNINTELTDLNISKNIISSIYKGIEYLGGPLINHIESLEKLRGDNYLLFKIKCKSIIIALGNSLLTQYFDKELVKFDNQITNILKANNLSNETIAMLDKRRDEIEENGAIDKLSLTPSEAKILSLELSDSNFKIISLFNIRAKAYQIINQLSSCITPENKSLLIKHLAKVISETLQDPNTASVKHKSWFSKQYVDESIYSHNPMILSNKI